MFKVDMDAVREAAIEARLVANAANVASPARVAEPSLASIAALAISHERRTTIDPGLVDLLEAAMRACDAWKDSETACIDMRHEVQQTPLHLRADLLEHLRKAYGNETGSLRREEP